MQVWLLENFYGDIHIEISLSVWHKLWYFPLIIHTSILCFILMSLGNGQFTHTQCWKLEQFCMPGICGNWLSLVNNCIYYANQTGEIYQVLPYSVDFKAHGELWNPLNKTVFGKCRFISNKGPRNIWNERKAQIWFVCQACKHFL